MRPNLPQNVMIEILSWLPVKFLMQFKCVCKTWYNLIKNPSFIALHLNKSILRKKESIIFKRFHHINTEKLLISVLSSDTLEVSRDVYLPFFDHDMLCELHICGSCNGIICLYGFNGSDDDGYSIGDGVVLWNPTTRELKVLPISHGLTRQGRMSSAIGFGFDPRTNDYKVVKIWEFRATKGQFAIPKPEVEVYNLSSNSWRKINAILPAKIENPSLPLNYLNGVCYWFASGVILSFDLSTEVFQTIALPPGVCDIPFLDIPILAFVVMINGSFVLGLSYFNPPSVWVDIWVLNQNNGLKKWVKQSRIGPHSEFSLLLGLWKNGVALIEGHDGWVLSYNTITQQIKNLEFRGSPCSSNMVVYTESLVSINGGNELMVQRDS